MLPAVCPSVTPGLFFLQSSVTNGADAELPPGFLYKVSPPTAEHSLVPARPNRVGSPPPGEGSARVHGNRQRRAGAEGRRRRPGFGF